MMRPGTTRYVRRSTLKERQQLAAGLRSLDAFTLQRCQILPASARGQRPGLSGSWAVRPKACAKPFIPSTPGDWPPCMINPITPSVVAWCSTPVRCGACCTSGLVLLANPRYLDAAFSGGRHLGARPAPMPGEHRNHAPGLKRLGVSWRRAMRCIISLDLQYAFQKAMGPADAPGSPASRVGARLQW
jgi:hypothetical protein